MQFAQDGSSATVLLGSTRVMTTVVGELEAPYPDRPSEGSVRYLFPNIPLHCIQPPFAIKGFMCFGALDVTRIQIQDPINNLLPLHTLRYSIPATRL